jgi:type I restriction enzyme R subunit
MDISEKNFESTIEAALLAAGPDEQQAVPELVREALAAYHVAEPKFGGYHKRLTTEYDKDLCLIRRDVKDFILATQPKEWEKFKRQHPTDTDETFFRRLAGEIAKRGTLDLLRKGMKVSGCAFKLAFFRPASGLNEEVQRLYAANIFSQVRQLYFSSKNEKSLDLAIFLNGLPILTAELKDPLTGQTVEHAMRQYRKDRDPREPLFAFGRCLAHFAVDPELVYMTTHLRGEKTFFLPFNQGRDRGAGNPPSWKGFATAYLWERIWSSDSVLDLVQNFVQTVEEEDDKGRRIGETRLVFPRYHQLDAVRRLVADARASGPGKRYLIQHSAGSGKSNSISWLAHQLTTLHGSDDRRVFDSIIVITDRRILDKQLQRNMRQFEQTVGVVENIDKTSRQLKQALEDGKNIIVTTLQKFPVIVDQIQDLAGKRFAVVIDEAHSSQGGGEGSKKMNEVLRVENLDEAEEIDRDEGDDIEDRINEAIEQRRFLKNVSYFAFTATPKPKTLQAFGVRQPDGSYEAFSLYSMRQAIEEGFILDVLQNYTTYKAYWSLLKKIEDDPHYDRTKATKLLKAFVELHRHAIGKKVEIIVEHFMEQVFEKRKIDGHAKAMIVTGSRLHAVRYKLAVDRYIKEHKLPFKALVAFSGTVRDGGHDNTEANMNGFSDSKTSEMFKSDEYRFLIVANKFQTGFDQPLLYVMYVDKKLGGVNAVQTLSRLNRIYPPYKDETMILDFANEADDIRKAFEPYYEKTILSEATDPNVLYDLQRKLEEHGFFDSTDVECFAGFYFDPKAQQDKLIATLKPVQERFDEAVREEQEDFRSTLADYVGLYAFLSQVLTFADVDLEKLYVFARMLLRMLPSTKGRLPVEVQQNINIDSYRIQRTSTGAIGLERGTKPLKPVGNGAGQAGPIEAPEPLSQIINDLNERFGTDFTSEDKVFIQNVETQLDGNTALEASLMVNSIDNARLTFDHVAADLIQEMMDTNFKFFKKVNDDEQFAEYFFAAMFDRYLKRKGGTAGTGM